MIVINRNAVNYLLPPPLASYNQFHQVYIHGKMSSCDMEKKRLFAYMRWRSSTGEKREKAVVSFVTLIKVDHPFTIQNLTVKISDLRWHYPEQKY